MPRAGDRDGTRACGAGGEVKLHGAADAVEAGAVAFGAGLAVVGHVLGGVDAELAQAGGGIVVVVFVGLEHPGENASVSAARRAPAARGVEREVLRVELGKGFAGLDIGAGGGEPGEHVAL